MNSVSKRMGCALLGWVALTGLVGCGGSDASSVASSKYSAAAGQHSSLVGTTTTPIVSPPLQAPLNTAPTIAGSMPAVIDAGKAFVFTPTAVDVDNDKLVFKISSKPGWATFDTRTGRISGTPTQADVGVHEDIVISVTDGKATVSLPKTDVTVEMPQRTVNATLSWQPPTQNADGSALVNLTGYKIHYGTKSQQYSRSVSVPGAGMTRYMIEDLTPGTYFFSITAITTSGVESNFSPEVSGEII